MLAPDTSVRGWRPRRGLAILASRPRGLDRNDDMKSSLYRYLGRNQPFSVKLTLTVLLAMCLLVPLLVGQILSEGRRTLDYYAALDRSVETRAEIRGIFLTIADAESNQRGYLLTGRQEFLDAYEDAARKVPLALQALEPKAAGTPLQSAVQKLRGLVEARLAVLARTVGIYQQAGSAAALEVVAQGTGQKDMDQIRATVDDMVGVENGEIDRLTQNVHREETIAQIAFLVLFGGIILAVLAAGATGLIHIAQRGETEEALTEAGQVAETAQREAEKANRAKSEFLATMSHEIRTPLHAVIGSTELLLDGDGLSKVQRDYIERIQAAGTALLNVVNDVLDLSKIEAGEVQLSPEPFSLEALIDNAVSIVRTTAQKKALDLRVTLDHDLPIMLRGDASRIRQVLLNLLNNAVKFTERGTVTLRVEHRGSSRVGESLRFSVSDTGPGIPQAQQDRLFKRFSQIGRMRGGTGLGLAISKSLVELMGGEIGLDSGAGHGSTFWFSLTLPRVEADQQPLPSIDLSEVFVSGTILVVDDLDQNRDLARRMLETAGYSVDVAADGSEALAAVQAATYDLVLMDVQMAGMDGVEATKMIRRLDGRAASVPIVAMTANVLAHEVKAFLAAGMSDHLGKPFKRSELLTKVRTWLMSGYLVDRSGRQTTRPLEASASAPLLDEIQTLHSMMGRDWVARGLSELNQQIAETFGETDVAAVDRKWLARQAHMLVSRAAILGFSELSQLCSALELACKTGNQVTRAFAQAKAAAARTQAMASDLLQTLDAYEQPRGR
jgi:signal transduction histidine kinase/CheY-like chemotaxis protein